MESFFQHFFTLFGSIWERFGTILALVGNNMGAPPGLRRLRHFLQGGWELNVVSGCPRGGQQEGQGEQTGISHAW